MLHTLLEPVQRMQYNEYHPWYNALTNLGKPSNQSNHNSQSEQRKRELLKVWTSECTEACRNLFNPPNHGILGRFLALCLFRQQNWIQYFKTRVRADLHKILPQGFWKWCEFIKIRISFCFTECTVSKSGYDGDDEDSSSDSSDNGNQGNVLDMWD